MDSDYSIFALLNRFYNAFSNTIGWRNVNHRTIDQQVTFWCSNRNHKNWIQTFVNDSNIFSKIDPEKSLVILSHGWLDNSTFLWEKEIVSEWLKFEDTNICVVDWQYFGLMEYTIAAKNTKNVGKYLSEFLKSIRKSTGIPYLKMTLCGHSMGAHVVGIAGGNIDGRIGRIIGLDPAGWSFTKPFVISSKNRLDKTDAKFVQCIHTDSSNLGSHVNLGHQDFYPNNGNSPQPGCFFPALEGARTWSMLIIYFFDIMLNAIFLLAQFSCSHLISTQFLRFSLNPKNKFVGTKCPNFSMYLFGFCDRESKSNFGIYSK